MKVRLIFLFTLFLIPVSSQAKKVRTLKLDDKTVATIPISNRGAVLSFPTKPSNVILGAKRSFGLEYVKSDLAISPLSSVARSNLFIYLDGRRFNLDLRASPNGYTLVIIKDTSTNMVRIKDE